jgi:amidophosphoribosyltransferase
LIASSHSLAEINQYITSDSLAYLSIEGMVEAVIKTGKGNNGSSRRHLPTYDVEPLTRSSFCDACWSGNYPIEFVPHPRHRQMRLLDT